MRRASLALALSLLPISAIGCALLVGITDREVGGDAGSDGGEESASDARNDTAQDTRTDAPDSSADSPTDSVIDSSVDSIVDSSIDSSLDSAVDSVVDDSGIDTSTTDSGVDTGTDTGTDSGTDTGTDTGVDTGPVDLPCSAATPTLAEHGSATAATNGGPSLAWDAASSRFGMAWAVGGATLQYEELSLTGTIVTTSDVAVAVATSGATPVFAPHVVDDSGGGKFGVAWGEHTAGGGGNAYAGIRRLNVDGTASGTAAQGTSDPDTQPPDVSGVAFDASRSILYTVGRLQLFGASHWRVDSFTGSLVPSKSTGVSSPGAIYTAIDFSSVADALEVVVVSGAAPSNAVVHTFDPTLLTESGSKAFAFASTSDTPYANPGPESAPWIVAGDAPHIGVVWLDTHGGTTADVYLTSLDATSLVRVAAAERAVTSSAIQKSFPRVAWDGKAFIVSWLEIVGAGTFKVMLQRYDPITLAPLTATPLCVSCGASGGAAISGIGLAVSGPDSYGVAYVNKSAGQIYFSHVTCP